VTHKGADWAFTVTNPGKGTQASTPASNKSLKTLPATAEGCIPQQQGCAMYPCCVFVAAINGLQKFGQILS